MMHDGSDQIVRLLETLAKNGALITEAFEGTIEFGDRHRNKAIDALASINAIKPYEEGIYRLNPRLREFIADHLVSYQAYQTLTRISGSVYQAKTQWSEIRLLRESGALTDADRLERAFDDSISEIAYAIERNLTLLHSLISTQYGNVSDLSSKLRQNTFYAKEIADSLKEMRQVDETFTKITAEALADGFLSIRQTINRRLLVGKLLSWTMQIKDAQAVITKRLFLARQLEERLRRLSRMSLWLQQNKTADGFEIEISERSPVALFKPLPIKVREQIDVRDTDAMVFEKLVAAIKRLPARELARASGQDESPKPQLVVTDSLDEITIEIQAHERKLDELLEELNDTVGPISLARWKDAHQDLNDLTVEEWLLFSSTELHNDGYVVTFVTVEEIDAFPVNEKFSDVLVMRG